MRRLTLILVALAGLIVGVSALTGAWVATRLQSSTSASVVPQVIQYQGVLADSNGKPLEDGVHGVSFRLYSAAQGGRPLWQEGHRVSTSNGAFTVILGRQQPFTRSVGLSQTPTSVFDTTPLYMGMAVGQQGEIQPCQMLAAVPFALYAANADTLNGLDSSAFARAGDAITCAFELRVRRSSRTFEVSDDCISITQIIPSINAPAGTIGHLSHTLGADGNPVMSFKRGGNLLVAKCGDLSCSSAQVHTVDSSTNVGDSSSIVIGTDGLPIISYVDNINKDLKVAHCSNASCSSATITTVDTDDIFASTFGTTTAITIGSDSMPVIAYVDTTPTPHGLLKIARCSNVTCTTYTTNHVLGNPVGTASSFELFTGAKVYGTVGLSIAVGQDGMPIIAYRYGFQQRMMMAHCNDLSCNSAAISRIGVVVAIGDTSIANGPNGLPILSYFTGGGITLVNCQDADCAGFSTTDGVAGLGDTGMSHRLALMPNGQIAISYSEKPISGLTSKPGLGLLKCTESGCSDTKLVNDDTPGLWNSLAIAPDGRIAVAYVQQGNRLMMAVCHGC
jgi:hypothetical protein